MRSLVLLVFAGLLTAAPASAVIPPTGETLTFVHNDHLGTPVAMTDTAGQVVWRATKKPFGTTTVDEDPDGDGQPLTLNLRFPGQYFDAETGMHYNWHRDYEPGIGRYVEADPIGLNGGLNIYIYVHGNPFRFSDPLGLFDCFRGIPRVHVSTKEETRSRTILKIYLPHPENFRPSVGGSFPQPRSPLGGLPLGPEVSIEWWLWKHTLKEFSVFDVTNTVTITTIWCKEERDCETYRWHYDDIDKEKTERLIDRYREWIHQRLYKIGSNSWPLPLP
jgi:RHS repeat-associated protein